jgi:hypothetical protein
LLLPIAVSAVEREREEGGMIGVVHPVIQSIGISHLM